jgi:hypothetical protein
MKKMESYPGKYLKGKRYSQDELIPIIILFIGGKGGKASKTYVEENVYELLRDEFRKDVYHQRVANNIPRWKHDIAWARERAKKNHGYIKPPTTWSRGIWELTEKGKAFYQELVQALERRMT